MLRTAEPVTLVIADISGYTRYLGGTELEHAENVLTDLLDTVITRLGPALGLLELEGDAAFMFAAGDAMDGSLLLDTLDACYAAFRRRRHSVAQATTCRCDACARIPTLDLKFVAHHGRAIRSVIGGREGLTGPDVIIVHRLLKNGVTSRLGLRAYALFTASCVEALAIDPDTLGLHPLLEQVDDVGPVDTWVLDLEPRWDALAASPPLRVTPEDASIDLQWLLAAPPPVVWTHLTIPERHFAWVRGLTGFVQENSGGRRGVGTVNHCAHGKDEILQEYLEWRPFALLTYEGQIPMIGKTLTTYELVPEGQGTRLHMRNRGLGGAEQARFLQMARSAVIEDLEVSHTRLGEVLREEQLQARSSS